MAVTKTATFGIKIPVETNAEGAAKSVEKLRDSIQSSKDRIKELQSSMQSLRGKSDEVKAAKKALKGALDAERDSISRNALALGKLGQTVNDTKGKTSAWREKLSDLGSTLKGGTLAAIETVATAAIAFTTAVVAAVAATTKWALETADMLRTMGLFREAASGSSANAKAWGEQIDDLAKHIATPRAELQALSLDIEKSLRGTRISGQGMVDTFKAVAQASAAMGDSAGKSLQDIITRGKQFGRFALGQFELTGTGLKFDDVAKELAANLKISLADARNQLVMGRVKIDDGAKAVNDAVTKRFGSVNEKLSLSLPTLATRFKETLGGLTTDINITPILDGVKAITEWFGKGTVIGETMRGIFTRLGDGFGKAFLASLPLAKELFIQFLIQVVKLEIVFYRTRNAFNEVFGKGPLKGVLTAERAIDGFKAAMGLAAAVMGTVAVGVAVLGVALYGMARPFLWVGEKANELIDLFQTMGWSEVGTHIVEGIADGIKSGWDALKSAVRALATGSIGEFRSKIDAHSPSREFAKAGRTAPEGAAEGIKAGKGEVDAAVRDMAPKPISMGKAMGGGAAPKASGGAVTLNATFSFPNATDGKSVKAEVESESFRAKVLKVFEDAARSAGIAIQGAQNAV